jgi:hypothetical protein
VCVCVCVCVCMCVCCVLLLLNNEGFMIFWLSVSGILSVDLLPSDETFFLPSDLVVNVSCSSRSATITN